LETVRRAAEVCGLRLAPDPAEEPALPGGDFNGDLAALEADLARETRLPPRCVARLVRFHGTDVREIARLGGEPLVPGAPLPAGEVEWGVRVEGAATLEALLYRRLRNVWTLPETRESAVEPASVRMAKLLGWSEERRRDEVQRALGRIASELAWRVR